MLLVSLLSLISQPAQATSWQSMYNPVEDPCTCTEPVLVCPRQVLAGAMYSIAWDNGTWTPYNPSGWTLDPNNKEEPPNTTIDFKVTERMEALTDAANEEALCGVLDDGSISCTGANGASVGVPTGQEPYESLTVNTRGQWMAIGNDGHIYTWGGATTIGGTIPTPHGTGTKYTSVSVGYNIACAVGDDLGVTCWGSSDSYHLTTNAARPTSGTYSFVEVSRYEVMALDANGGSVGWNTDVGTRAANSGAFIGTRPTEGVVYVELASTGEPAGWALIDTGLEVGASASGKTYMYIWDSPTMTTTPPEIAGAPGFDTYHTPGVNHSYIPRGPEWDDETGFYITWKSVDQRAVSTAHWTGAVVDDGKGLPTYSPQPDGSYVLQDGSAVTWKSSLEEFDTRAQCSYIGE